MEILSVLLAYTQSDPTVCPAVTDLVDGRYLDEDAPLVVMATDDLRRETLAGDKIIVIAEGSSDAPLIRQALELVVPSVIKYFSFLNFDLNKASGGTDRVVSLTRGMASAGVMNRVYPTIRPSGSLVEEVNGRARLKERRLSNSRFAAR